MITDYIKIAFEQQDKLVENFKRLSEGVDYDMVIGTGLSGTIAASIISSHVNCHLGVVRKSTENSHSSQMVEGDFSEPRNWIFVDDFVASGETLKRVLEKVREAHPSARPVGGYLYNHHGPVDEKWVVVGRWVSEDFITGGVRYAVACGRTYWCGKKGWQSPDDYQPTFFKYRSNAQKRAKTRRNAYVRCLQHGNPL